MKEDKQTVLESDINRNSITALLEMKILVLENIFLSKVGSVEEIYQSFSVSLDYLTVLRHVHSMLRKNLLVKTKIGQESIYRRTNCARYLKKYFHEIKELNSVKSIHYCQYLPNSN